MKKFIASNALPVTCLSYTHNGRTYGMNITGEKEEVEAHLERLIALGVKDLEITGTLCSITEVDVEVTRLPLLSALVKGSLH